MENAMDYPPRWVVKVALWLTLALMVLALVVPVAIAQSRSATAGRATVTLHDSPCVHKEVLRHIQPQHHSLLKAGSGVWDGKPYALCWASAGQSVVLIWEDGGVGQVPLALFGTAI